MTSTSSCHGLVKETDARKFASYTVQSSQGGTDSLVKMNFITKQYGPGTRRINHGDIIQEWWRSERIWGST